MADTEAAKDAELAKADAAEPQTFAAGRVTSAVEIATGLVLVAIAAVALFWLIPNHVTASGGEHDVGPGFFPQMAAGVVLVLALAQVVTNAVSFRGTHTGRPGLTIVIEIAIWSVISVLTVLGIARIGFLPTTPFLIVLGALACGYRKWWLIGALAITVPVAIDQAAWLMFTVDLP